MKPIKQLKAKTGTYKDRQTGEEKNSYSRVGTLFQRDDGSFCVKIDSIPVNFDGWVNAWDLPSEGARQAAQAPAPQSNIDTGSDLPF